MRPGWPPASGEVGPRRTPDPATTWRGTCSLQNRKKHVSVAEAARCGTLSRGPSGRRHPRKTLEALEEAGRMFLLTPPRCTKSPARTAPGGRRPTQRDREASQAQLDGSTVCRSQTGLVGTCASPAYVTGRVGASPVSRLGGEPLTAATGPYGACAGSAGRALSKSSRAGNGAPRPRAWESRKWCTPGVGK